MVRILVGSVLLGLVGACGGSEPAPAKSDNVLRLELGGSQQSLDAALRAVDAGYRAERERGEAADTRRVSERVSGRTEDRTRVEEPPQPEPLAESGRSVTLRKGQTVYGLAKDYLGSSGRWKEILELNGWSEEEAMRLREGVEVKLPPR